MQPTRHVIVLAVDGVQSLDVLGPIEAFHYAELQAPGSYRVELVGRTGTRAGRARMSP